MNTEIPMQQKNNSRNRAAIVGLILGIFSAVFCLVPWFQELGINLGINIFSWLSVWPAWVFFSIAIGGCIISLILSIIGLRSSKKRLAVGGLICACIGLLSVIAFFILLLSLIDLFKGFSNSLH